MGGRNVGRKGEGGREGGRVGGGGAINEVIQHNLVFQQVDVCN